MAGESDDIQRAATRALLEWFSDFECIVHCILGSLHNSQLTHMYSKKTRKTTSFHFAL